MQSTSNSSGTHFLKEGQETFTREQGILWLWRIILHIFALLRYACSGCFDKLNHSGQQGFVREQSIDAVFQRRIHGSEKFRAAMLGSLKFVCCFFCKCRAVGLWEILIAALQRAKEMEGEKVVVWGFLDLSSYQHTIAYYCFRTICHPTIFKTATLTSDLWFHKARTADTLVVERSQWWRTDHGHRDPMGPFNNEAPQALAPNGKTFFVRNFAAPHQARSKPDWPEPDPNQVTANGLKKRDQMDFQMVSNCTLRSKLFCRYGLPQIKTGKNQHVAWMF